MVLELLDRFHLGDIVHLSVGYAILETSLHVFVGFSGLIEMGSADLERILLEARRELQRGSFAVAFLDSCSNINLARLDAG